MNNSLRYLVWFLIIAAIALLVWYLRPVLAYLAISAVFSLIGRPVVEMLSRPLWKGKSLPRGVAAGVTLILMWTLILTFIGFFVPVVISEAKDLSSLNMQDLLTRAGLQPGTLENFLQRFGQHLPDGFSAHDFLVKNAGAMLNTEVVTSLFSSLADFLGNFFVTFFSISFITFFFLKEQELAGKWFLLLIPEKYENQVKNALYASKKLLMRYFTGLLGEMTGVMILLLTGLLITGLGFRESILVAVFAGILTIIPYVGPLIGTAFGLFIGIATELTTGAGDHLLLATFWLIVVFGLVHLIDNMVFQPLIYSSSIHAHPLEIFLVILAAGSIWGIPGMIAAIPSYTVLRVFVKEFMYSFHL